MQKDNRADGNDPQGIEKVDPLRLLCCLHDQSPLSNTHPKNSRKLRHELTIYSIFMGRKSNSWYHIRQLI